jgi:hypothetical protein
MSNERNGVRAEDEGDDTALGRIETALRGLRFGTVTAVVQNGVVVQVERTEKVRLQRADRER